MIKMPMSTALILVDKLCTLYPFVEMRVRITSKQMVIEDCNNLVCLKRFLGELGIAPQAVLEPQITLLFSE